MIAARLIQFVPVSASAISTLWLIMSILFGMLCALPSIDIQALFGVVAFLAHGYFAIDADVESFAVMLLFFWLIKDTYIICQHLFSNLLDDLKPKRMAHLRDDGKHRRTHPPWSDAAPYLPDGGCYGYSMSQYHL